jgi:hypothetical protein
MVLTKSELLTALKNEVRILLHLAGKIDRTRPHAACSLSSTCCKGTRRTGRSCSFI